MASSPYTSQYPRQGLTNQPIKQTPTVVLHTPLIHCLPQIRQAAFQHFQKKHLHCSITSLAMEERRHPFTASTLSFPTKNYRLWQMCQLPGWAGKANERTDSIQRMMFTAIAQKSLIVACPSSPVLGDIIVVV